MAEIPEWKKFEGLIERIQRQLHPNASITRNERLRGQNSGQLREVDICIRYKLGSTNLLIVLDCKKRGRPVSVPEMDSFVGLKADVRAHVGIMVAESGFSTGAVEVATRNSIEPYTFVDTEKADWDCRVRVPICVEDWMLLPMTFQRINSDGTKQNLPERAVVDGKSIRLVVLVKELWDQERDKRSGIHGFRFALPNCMIDVEFQAQVERFVRSGWLSLMGLTKEEDGLTYSGEAHVTMTHEPPQFHEHGTIVPPHETSPHAIPVLHTSVNGRSFDLRDPRVTVRLSFSGKGKPLAYDLRKKNKE